MAAGIVSKILPFLNNLIPSALAMKGLSKIDPRFEKFFTNSLAAGFGTDQAISFLRNKFSGGGPSTDSFMNETQERVGQGIARPDEAAALQDVQASQRLPNALQKGVSLATGLGAGLAGNEDEPVVEDSPRKPDIDIPADFGPNSNFPGAKTITKYGKEHPVKFGNKLPVLNQRESATAERAPLKNVPPQQAAQSAPQQSNLSAFQRFIKQYPDLGKALDKRIGKGMGIREAASDVKQSKLYKPVTKKIESDLGQPFEDLLEQLIGASPGSAPQQQQPQQQDGGPGNEALMQVLSRLTGLMGNK